jgi:hypothetical protein
MRPFTESPPLPFLGAVTQTIARPWIASVGKFLFWSVAFGVSYTQAPLYTSNQNTKFIRGLAEGGLGLLQEDWLAHATDVLPVFTFLVYLTYRYLHEYMFYFYNIVIFGVYLYSMSGIVSTVCDIKRDRFRHVTYLTIITVLHSYAFDSLSSRLLGFELGQFLHYGVAEQHVIGRIFQPSVFGVLILLSIYAFLQRNVIGAIFLIAFSATIHPGYFLAAAIFTGSYMFVVFSEQRSIKSSLAVGLLSLVLTLPALIYFYLEFSPTSPEIWRRAQDILVNFRSPHHMKAAVWLSATAYGKIVITAVALYLVRTSKLFPIMLFPFLVFLLSILAQLLTGSSTLAASTPWRISVFLVPLSVCLIVGFLVSRVFDQFREQIARRRAIVTLVNCALVLLALLYGARTQVNRHVKHYQDESIPMMHYVKESKSSGEIYLVPVELEDFRLYTGAPTFVTFKSGPYKDVEYLEWYRRLVGASEFYRAEDEIACDILKKLERDYNLTHVVVKGQQPGVRCEKLSAVYKDERYRVYKIEKERSFARN